MGALRVGVLAYPGCFASEVFGVPDLLTMASHIVGPEGPGFDVSVVSPRRRVVASGGATLTTSPMSQPDVLVVPGFELAPGLDLDSELGSITPEIASIRDHCEAGRSTVSICVGAFLLGEAGLLDGRRATTAWLFADELARRYPDTTVESERLVVSEQGVTTTAAFSAMYDFALELIRKHSGAKAARSTARVALVDDARTDQTPYVDSRLLPTPGREFSQRIMRQLDQDLAAPYDLTELAAQANVSTRTLLRRFTQETGQTPLKYLQHARIRQARHLLEATDRTVSSIATAVGYRDPGTFARLFARHTGQRPRDYRASFRRRPA